MHVKRGRKHLRATLSDEEFLIPTTLHGIKAEMIPAAFALRFQSRSVITSAIANLWHYTIGKRSPYQFTLLAGVG